jgi:hypothetical protein
MENEGQEIEKTNDVQIEEIQHVEEVHSKPGQILVQIEIDEKGMVKFEMSTSVTDQMRQLGLVTLFYEMYKSKFKNSL